MTLQLFAHPFSSYCWKVEIALYENATPFELRILDGEHPGNSEEWVRRWPLAKMPVLVDGERTVAEASVIVAYLQALHPGPVRLIPDDPWAAAQVGMLDRVFDLHVQSPMQAVVNDALRPAEAPRDPYGVARAKEALEKVYAWLDGELAGRTWAAGEDFTLADCAAAPALFYADWVHPIAGEQATLKAYRARLLERPSVARTVEEARPYRPFFPLGAPDRD